MPSVRPLALVAAAALVTLAAGCAAPTPVRARAVPAPTARPAPPVDPIDTGEDTGLAHPR